MTGLKNLFSFGNHNSEEGHDDQFNYSALTVQTKWTEDEQNYYFKVALPGLTDKDILIKLDDSNGDTANPLLIIKAAKDIQRTLNDDHSKGNYGYNPFQHRSGLTRAIDSSSIQSAGLGAEKASISPLASHPVNLTDSSRLGSTGSFVPTAPLNNTYNNFSSTAPVFNTSDLNQISSLSRSSLPYFNPTTFYPVNNLNSGANQFSSSTGSSSVSYFNSANPALNYSSVTNYASNQYQSVFPIPTSRVKVDEILASVDNGVLTIKFPKVNFSQDLKGTRPIQLSKSKL